MKKILAMLLLLFASRTFAQAPQIWPALAENWPVTVYNAPSTWIGAFTWDTYTCPANETCALALYRKIADCHSSVQFVLVTPNGSLLSTTPPGSDPNPPQPAASPTVACYVAAVIGTTIVTPPALSQTFVSIASNMVQVQLPEAASAVPPIKNLTGNP